MTTRRTPDGQVYTEVPVVPRHDQLDGRTLDNSHPISAITGLQEALDSKADAVDGGNLVTDEEKAKIETMEANAQENTIEVVKVNGTALTPDASKAVDVAVPTTYGVGLSYVPSNGRLELRGPGPTPQLRPVIDSITLPRKGLTAMALDADTKALTATLQDGTIVSVDLSDAADPYTAGNGLSLADGAFSLSSQTEGLLEDVADHLSDQTAHVSAADRTKWDGCAQDSEVVHKAGSETIPGAKTFTSPVGVGSPTGPGHAVDMATLSARLSDGSVTKVGTADVGTDAKPIKLVGGVPMAVGADLATDSAVVHKEGEETIPGAKTFASPLTIERYEYSTNRIKMGRAYNNSYRRAVIEVYDKKDNEDSLFASDTFNCQYSNGYNTRAMAVAKPERDGTYAVDMRSYADHQEIRVTPYYPVDGSGNPQALPSTSLVASGNVAVDPRVVHTTGTETVAGNKTYTGQANLQGATQVTGAWANKPAAVPRASLGWHRVLEYVQPASGTTNRQAIWLMSTQGMLDSQTGGMLDAVGILAMSCSGDSAQAVWLAGSKVRPEDAVMVKDWSGGKWRWTLWVNQVHTNEGRMVERLSERSSTGLANSFAVCEDIATAYASLPEAHTPGEGEDPSTEVKVVASVIGSMT